MKINRKAIAAALLAVCLAAFFVFLGRVYQTEGNHVANHQESCREYYVLDDLPVHSIADETAPLGVRQEYRWLRAAGELDGASIAFYLVHQGAEVYYNDELVYAIAPEAENRLTRSPGSNWVILPLHDASHDCDVRIVITPYSADYLTRRPDVMVGSLYTMLLDLMQENLIYVLLSLLSMIMGAAMLVMCLCNVLTRKRVSGTVGYLGVTMLLLGVWRITDTQLSPMIFPNNVLALDYISVGTLFLICVPFGLATRSGIRKHMYLMSACCAVVCMGVLAGSVAGLWDIRDLLVLAHGMIALNALAIIFAESVLLIKHRTMREAASLVLALLPMAGALADIVAFYVRGLSTGVLYVIVGFLAYAALLFAGSLRDARKRMFADEQTGLNNRAKWESLMDEYAGSADGCGVILFDLNGLKQANDTLGHAAGDAIIRNFADILRRELPAGVTLCRWGGDEYAVFAPEASEDMLENVLANVRRAVTVYNHTAGELQLEYAEGCVCGSEAPGLTPRELFRMADQRMYYNKRSRREGGMKENGRGSDAL